MRCKARTYTKAKNKNFFTFISISFTISKNALHIIRRMNIPKATLSSKKQITIPAEVCKKMNLSPKMKILFLEVRPGQFQLIPAQKKLSQKDWLQNLYGKYEQPGVDGVRSLLDDRKEDLILEERGYLQ